MAQTDFITERRLGAYHDELMKTHVAGGCVFDISAYHATGTPPVLATYADLAAALGTNGANVPEALRKGGMSVKFVQSNDNKYVQYRLMSTAWSTTASEWQGVDDEPTAGSENLVKSGGVKSYVDNFIGDYDVSTNLNTLGQIRTDTTETPISISSNNTYILKLVQLSNLDASVAVNVYLKINGSFVGQGNLKVGEELKISGIDANAIGYYISGTTGSSDYPIIMHITGCLTFQVNTNTRNIDVTKKVEKVAFDEYLEYKAIAANSSRTAFSANKGERIRIVTKGYDGANGTIDFRFESSNTTVNYVSINVNGDTEVTLSNAISTISWYINNSMITSTGRFELVLIREYDEDTLQINSLKNRINCIFDYQFEYKRILENASRMPVSISKGAKITVICKSDPVISNKSASLYFKNATTTIKLFTIKDGDVVEFEAGSDITTVSIYIADNITPTGYMYFAIYNDTKEGVQNNIIYGPVKIEKISGSSTYLSKNIVEADTIPGDVYFIGFDSFSGVVSKPNALLIRFLNGTTQVSRKYFCEPSHFTAPDGCNKVEISLYPNPSGTAQEVNAVYSNIYVAKGRRAEYLLDAEFSNISTPPDYYFETSEDFPNGYLNDKVNRINELLVDNYTKGDAFIFITDLHWVDSIGTPLNQHNSPSLIKYIKERTGITKIICGGDFYDGVSDGFINLLTNDKKNKDFIVALGNHEYLQLVKSSTLALTYGGSKYEQLFKGNIDKWYYFFDDDFRKIRYIVLASFYESENTQTGSGSTAASNGYTQEQFTWLSDVALANVPSEYDILVISHGQYNPSHDSQSPGGYTSGNETLINTILDTYKENNSNRHILRICGHFHRDRVIMSSGGIPSVIVTCDKNIPWTPSGGTMPDIDVTRTSGTIREQAFDVCILNTDTHTLTAVRIGGVARDGVGSELGDEVEERVINY